MKKLIRLAVERPVGVTVIFFAVAVFGFVALRQLAVDLLPSIDVPQITITTAYEGVAPAEIETLVTRPIEQATSTIEGVDRIESESSEGLSRVRLQFRWGTPLDVALDEARVALDRVRSQLPEDAETPAIFKFDLASVPILHLGLTGTGDTRQLKQLARDELSRALERVPGVASVQVDGGQDREIRVALDPNRLEALGISPEQVAAALAKENRTVSAGDMRDAGREVVIRTAGEFTTMADIESVVVATREQQPIRVRDLGAVLDTIREMRSELWIDGELGIRLRIFKQSGVNTVEVARAVREEVERLNQTYGERAELSVLWDASEFIESAVSNVQSSAAQGAFLAALVLLVFLRSARATLIIATSIPLSIIAIFGLMHFYDMTLNIVSFGGVALGVGMLVDASIVILESIDRKRRKLADKREAAIAGGAEVGGAVTSGVLTTVVVFAPVVFVGGLAGVLFGEMALVVTCSLFCSLAVALTLVPMLAARWLPSENEVRARGLLGKVSTWLAVQLARVDDGYGRVLRSACAAPWGVVVAGAALLVAAGALALRVPTELMPEADEGTLDVDVELAMGTPLETTSPVMRQIEKRVLEALRPGEVRHVITSVGPEAWWRPGGSHEGEVELTLAARGERGRSMKEIEAAVRKAVADVPGAQMRIRPRSSNVLTRIVRRGADRVSVEIRGHDLDTVDGLAEQVIPVMEATPGVTHAQANRDIGKLERVLRVDRARAAELGIGSGEIASAVEHYVLGRVATRLRDGGDEFDIRVQLAAENREQLELLPSLPIMTPSGERVPLSSLVTIEESRSPSSITRVDQERVLRIDAGKDDRALADIVADLQAQIGTIPTPPGYQLVVAGEREEQKESFETLLLGLLLATCLVYAVMALQFESARQPLIVMASVPFAFIGVVAALLLTGTTFSMNAFLGVIVLVGIVVNNAIVLVDCVNMLRREEGLELQSAIIEAGRRRLRPILMTSITTVLGLVPMAIGASEGAEMQTPLARTVIGGLVTSTAVTLVLIPCLYLLVERRRVRAPAASPALVGDTAE